MEAKAPSLYRAFVMYGALLTDKQREIFEDYFGLDLSLGEIAELRGVSRQAVKDALSHAEKQLAVYEERLRFCSRIDEADALLELLGTPAAARQQIKDLMEGR